MRFSVVIPNHNRLDLIKNTLLSVFRQTFLNYEVIVVDDGSTDGSAEWVASEYPGVGLIRQQNLGPGAARNAGARVARGEYLAFLDSDDVWFPWSLATYAVVAQLHGLPSFIVGRPKIFLDRAELVGVESDTPKMLAFADYLAAGDEWRWWGVSSFVVNRASFEASGGFTEELINGEDADLALKLGETRGFVQITSPYCFGYRRHSDNLTCDLTKTLAGVSYCIRSEKSGRYPGGTCRARERIKIIARHMRPVALECMRAGRRDEGWRLYRETFRWHLSLRRWKFLLGFPVRAALAWG